MEKRKRGDTFPSTLTLVALAMLAILVVSGSFWGWLVLPVIVFSLLADVEGRFWAKLGFTLTLGVWPLIALTGQGSPLQLTMIVYLFEWGLVTTLLIGPAITQRRAQRQMHKQKRDSAPRMGIPVPDDEVADADDPAWVRQQDTEQTFEQQHGGHYGEK